MGLHINIFFWLKSLDEELQKKENQLEQQKNQDELSEVERAWREVKEEATKGIKADMEVQHGKLLHLENDYSQES